MVRGLAAVMLVLASTAGAQVVRDCDPLLAQARNIAEPWEQSILTLLDGEIRLAVIDAIEPGAVPFHLMILTPPYDEHGARVCHVVSRTADVFGFSALTLAGMVTTTDAAGRLNLRLQAGTYNDQTGATDPGVLTVIIDPLKGQVTARMP